MNYATRIHNLRAAMGALHLQAFAVTHLTNVRYLSGYTGTAGMLLCLPDTTYFLTDFRYRTQAASQVGDLAHIVIADKGMWKEAAKLLKKHGVERVGFEAEHTSVAAHEDIGRTIAPTRTVAATGTVEKLRLIKEEDELVIMREAARIADKAFAHALNLLKPGISELEVANQIELKIRELGGQGTSFDTIVASGTRSALPHGVASEKLLEKGDMVTIDMGARFAGYCSDMTRTVCLGKASKRHKEIYALTHRAQVAASAAMRPGFGCKAADAVAREIITEAGYGEYFGHGLGHGVGMDIHEQPRLSKLGKGKLAAGMVVTSEPGIYLPEWGGVRIEDMLVITPEGVEILTGTPKPAKLLEV